MGWSWGGYLLRGGSTNVYFSPREFAGAFQHNVYGGLCHPEPSSSAPLFSLETTDPPSTSPAPTKSIKHNYAKDAKEEGLCPEED